ncbi:hypothetical protein PR003_g28268 [Phytophthora rubi]|uniref:Secreted protein n=1 Tax=Phytophthora rubi TaxID=129364 RepID=A0A6A4BT77_9STRA|nr:hypothetical protein PR002_g27194 [Phytophthora rubi]KAE8970812.1 hypothetical protein PR001_g27093 [Phytophthora rubi]KAE9279293.1 hypothetical protein PR003_g28268 [Phytophthora rubi]
MTCRRCTCSRSFFYVYLKVDLLVAVVPLPRAATACAASRDGRATSPRLTLRPQLAPLPPPYSIEAPVYRRRGCVGAPEWGELLPRRTINRN